MYDQDYQGIVLHIDRRAPAIMKKIVRSGKIYDDFAEYMKVFRYVNVEEVKSFLENISFFVSERIPREYILEIEEV